MPEGSLPPRTKPRDKPSAKTGLAHYGIGPERVRQLVNRHVYNTTGGTVNAKAIAATARRIRHEKNLAAAHSQAHAILAADREGQQPRQIARRLGLRTTSVKAAIGAHGQ